MFDATGGCDPEAAGQGLAQLVISSYGKLFFGMLYRYDLVVFILCY
jgi:hypothetical protein